MPAPRKYDQETRDRAVRMFRERRATHPQESAIESRRQIGALIDVNSETIRGWVERAEIDAGTRPGTTSDDQAELLRLRREDGSIQLRGVAELLVADRVAGRRNDDRGSRLVGSADGENALHARAEHGGASTRDIGAQARVHQVELPAPEGIGKTAEHLEARCQVVLYDPD